MAGFVSKTNAATGVKTLSEEDRLAAIRSDSRRIGLLRMDDLFRQGFWPWNKKKRVAKK